MPGPWTKSLRRAKRYPSPTRIMANPFRFRSYPWSLYAVFQTTITQWAFPYDCALIFVFHMAMKEAGYYHTESEDGQRQKCMLLWALFLGHMIFSKTIKLVPHLLRNPGDIRFVPVSILFGYFHNFIKFYGFITVTEVRSFALLPHVASYLSRPSANLFLCRQPGARARARMRTTTSECCQSHPWPRSRRHSARRRMGAYCASAGHWYHPR